MADILTLDPPLTTSRRQLACYEIPQPPATLSQHLSKETFDKAQSYGRDKTRYAVVQTIYTQFVNYAMIRLGAYHKLWEATGGLLEHFGFANGNVS